MLFRELDLALSQIPPLAYMLAAARSIMGSVVFLGVLFSVAACSRVPEPYAPRYSSPAATSTTVAMHLLHTNDRAVLPLVQIDMKGLKYWWLLDTGSSHNLIATGLAEQLKLKAVASSEMATIGGRQMSTHYELPTFSVGGLALKQQSATATNLTHLSAPGYVVSGILGVPALAKLAVSLDFHQRKIVLANSSAKAVSQGGFMSVPFNIRGGVPVARAVINGNKPADFVLDTGNATSLVVLPSFSGLNPETQFSFVETRDLGGNIPARLARIRQLNLGQQSYHDVPVSMPLSSHRYQQAGVAGSLGNGLLRRQQVIFDFPRNRLLVQHKGQGQQMGGGFGFRLAQSNLIEVVLPNSPAQRNGLQVGDRIVAVNGQRANNAYQIWPRLFSDKRVQLTLQRGEQLRDVVLERSHFLPALN
uniref:PDZ domain (Also known as DHR or GLGF) n=1 Tax=uncultured Thiotrichaceae bacterium TaxID=298394 RepID=A0A6S6UAJ8_9GAMM|nr:MAG: PDZ domain (Also known as DHR or GLGF) [uncultured Thiotrichaceae bacterium]